MRLWQIDKHRLKCTVYRKGNFRRFRKITALWQARRDRIKHGGELFRRNRTDGGHNQAVFHHQFTHVRLGEFRRKGSDTLGGRFARIRVVRIDSLSLSPTREIARIRLARVQ